MNLFKKSLLERTNIETNKLFQRLSEKTQVLVPQTGGAECTKNRLTHSYEVATSAMLMATDIAEKLNVSVSEIDYRFALNNVCLSHDLGASCLGHIGQRMISEKFKEMGLEEGFCDNNNNLVVIEKNQILLSDYTLASLIKYPHKLYKSQVDEYQGMLDNAIKMDKEHFKGLGVNLKDQKRTITCQIMDEADRNSYVCSDLADFFCLGNSVSLKEIRTFAKGKRFDLECSELSVLADLVRSNSKTAIKAYFNTLKNRFNFNYTITDSGLNVSNQDLDDYREFLYAFEVKFFIKPTMKTEKHESNLKALEYYIDYVHHMEYYPSKTYKALIEGAKNSQEALTHMRDMIAETTDWYVIDFKPSGLQV